MNFYHNDLLFVFTKSVLLKVLVHKSLLRDGEFHIIRISHLFIITKFQIQIFADVPT